MIPRNKTTDYKIIGRHSGLVFSKDYHDLEVLLQNALYSALERGDDVGAELTRGELALLNIALARKVID